MEKYISPIIKIVTLSDTPRLCQSSDYDCYGVNIADYDNANIGEAVGNDW